MTTPNGLPAITCKELRQVQSMTEPHLILDVREPAEFEAGHIDGSMHIPVNELETNLPSLARSRDEMVVVVGEEGEKALETHQHLKNAGFTRVRFLLGGFDEWCKPAEPDVSDVIQELEEQKEILEDRPEHEEEVDSENDNQPLL